MRPPASLLLLPLLLTGSLASQEVPDPGRPLPRGDARRLDLVRGSIQELQWGRHGGAVHVTVHLAGALRRIDLTLRDLRAPDFRLLEARDGNLHRIPTPPPTTYRGQVAGVTASRVAASIDDRGLHAIVGLGRSGGPWAIQPLDGAGGTGGPHVVYWSGDVRGDEHVCGLDTGPPPRTPVRSTAGPDGNAPVVAELAIDADSRFRAANGGSTTQTQNDVMAVINAVDTIFQQDANVQYRVATILVRTSGSDPYSTSSPSGLLDQFRTEWNQNHTSIGRDATHLFTGRNLNGSVIGIATLNTFCSPSGAYGLSQSRFTSNLTRRVALTAHELGHNWGAYHCDGTSSCQIMCSGLGGCSGVLTAFGPRAKQTLIGKAAVLPCLSQPTAPVLSGITPGIVGALGGESVEITGSALADARQMQFGGAVLKAPDDYRIVDDQTIRMVTEKPASLGPVPITVTSPLGTSAQAVTLDFQAPAVPELRVAGTWVTGVPLEFTMLGQPGHYWVVIGAAGTGATSPRYGLDLLTGFSQIGVGNLDGVGVGGTSIVLPAALQGMQVHTQMVTVDPVTVVPLATSPHSTLLLF